MNKEQLLKNLEVPTGLHDAVLDTDTYNEVDDQFALAYMLRCSDRIRTRAVYAAPFFNTRSESPKDGMKKSYHEIFRVLKLCNREDLSSSVYEGSETFLPDERTPVQSPAAKHLVSLSKEYSAENPLYVIAIGAITNVASALIMDPTVAERCVVVWLGGHCHEWHDTNEFNMRQDVAAARVVFGSGIPVVQFPCAGVVDKFSLSEPEIKAWLIGKNPLADYLARNVIDYCKSSSSVCWSKVIWDVTAVSWLSCKSFIYKIKPILLPGYDNQYDFEHPGHPFAYVYCIKKDVLLAHLIEKLTEE